MAYQIPFGVVEHILTKLGSRAFQEIGSMCGVPKELTKLNGKLGVIKAVLSDAEEKQQQNNHEVKYWVRKLNGVVYDTDDLLDDYATHYLQRGGLGRQVSDFFSSENQVAFHLNMSHRLKDIKERIDDIAKDILELKLTPRCIHTREENSGRETHSFVLKSEMVGREENKEEIIGKLLSSKGEEKLSVVAIVGIGGLGKTTLAQLVYNDERVVNHFEFEIWACISDDSGDGLDVKLWVKKILKSMGVQDVETLDGLKDVLYEKISQKKYLLVLDDVWNENPRKWYAVKKLLMVGARGSKIIVTTRKLYVASIMGDKSPVSLKGLGEKESWALFSKLAFGEQEILEPEIVEIGEEIAKMCKGVPLVIKSLATILQSKREPGQWLSIRNNKNLLSLGDENENVLGVLKLSYDNLPTHLKQCFTYCALFPKDYEIEKKLVVQLWMAQGYIQSSYDNKEQLEDTGDQYVEELLSRSLLKTARTNHFTNTLMYKMHNLMHDLAQLIVKPEILVLRSGDNNIPKEARHVLLFEEVNPIINASQKISLRTFFMVNEDGFEDDSKDDSIINTSSKCLRVLSLNKFNIKKVPKFVGKLSHLRYLDLSNNDFKVLPSAIARLKHLQTLKVIDCVNLKELPKDTRELVHLRHLENDGCANLTHMPCGIGELTSLQSLPIFVVGNRRGYSRDRKIGGLNELEKLDYLRGQLRIKNLENVWNAEESSEAKLAKKQHIRSLRLEWRDPEANDERCKAAESVMEELRPHDQLEKLWIDGYKGEKFPNWMHGYNDGLFSKLVHIVLFSCERCQILPPFAQLPALKFMWLSGLEEVEYVTDCSSATPPFFPSLQMLKLDNLPKLKGLRKKGSSSEEDPSFPLLSKLDVGFCHKLTSLTLHSSPSLSEASLTLHHCLNLKSLTLPSSPCLLELSINTCCNLESLELPSSGLSKLYITECNDLKSLNLHSSPDLSQLTIRDCNNLTSLAQPPSRYLSQLEIRDCPNLTSFELHSAPELSSLEIRDCPKLTSLEVPLLPGLEKLHLNTLNKEVLHQFTFVSASRHT
ncbi:hypothetical protein VitviT2T_030599 [Vitis vinifera]|uniref:Disease resistance protein RGA3 n=2 Tax=Vitis vinifera TaxID=29760 RepID=A0ABY9E007_VITVI|nr:putative disease resistance protein RGA3 [Vitis vinifera]XP_010644932.1 putative disease resistance protein RGA3 [Vitis vinifera]XP_010644936.1 putative disease resistance protein RGA3 [Vitis vinifera]XP_010644939.1 putative disease resistance protein RGA3 [Vitis vinifera]XP_019072735.1 putative disease resistance protein RGA3 [Vitis vinifera]XP_019072737.1 putative disease resistance protein RGA3 [Vitis vinifera]XP_019072742.1 putative disease resistance protein RGA3 [Vitis vinifera]XP_0|eukprot:XP_010644923.1 PREDICTED: putative disease resistance protein RGA3 [Vitis vinifera]